MDIVTDLTAEAVCYIILYQDILKGKASDHLDQKLLTKKSWLNLTVEDIEVEELTPNQQEQIKDLIWHSPAMEDPANLSHRYFTSTLGLLQWLSTKIPGEDHPEKRLFSWLPFVGKKEENEVLILFQPPFFWRQQIRALLYNEPKERIALVEKLRYMPLQVVSVLAGTVTSPYRIRLYQLYEFSDESPEHPIIKEHGPGI